MAKLLVRTVDGENPLRYMKGDVVAVLPDSHVFGRMESLAVWTAEGRNPAEWPGGFAVVELEGLTETEARQYVEEAPAGARRKWRLDYELLERRAAGGGRDTLRTEKYIKRAWADADVPGLFRLKG